MYLLQVIRETNPQSSDYSSLPYVMQIFIAKESEDLAQLYWIVAQSAFWMLSGKPDHVFV